MRKTLLSVILIATLFAGDRLATAALGHLVLSSGVRFSAIYRGGVAADLVILGNSRGDLSFLPADIEQQTGLKVFQLAHKGMSTEISDAFWSDYSEKNQMPKILLIEVSSLSDNNGVIADMKTYGYWSPRVDALFRLEHKAAHAAAQFSKLYYMNGETVFRSAYFLAKSDQNKNRNNTAVLDPKLTQELVEQARQKSLSWGIKAPNLVALRHIVDLCLAQNCRPYLIFAPWHPLYETVERGAIQAGLAQVRSEFAGRAPLLDYSAAVSDTSAFGDLTHVNAKGARLLLDRMKTDGVFNQSLDSSTAAGLSRPPSEVVPKGLR